MSGMSTTAMEPLGVVTPFKLTIFPPLFIKIKPLLKILIFWTFQKSKIALGSAFATLPYDF